MSIRCQQCDSFAPEQNNPIISIHNTHGVHLECARDYSIALLEKKCSFCYQIALTLAKASKPSQLIQERYLTSQCANHQYPILISIWRRHDCAEKHRSLDSLFYNTNASPEILHQDILRIIKESHPQYLKMISYMLIFALRIQDVYLAEKLLLQLKESDHTAIIATPPVRHHLFANSLRLSNPLVIFELLEGIDLFDHHPLDIDLILFDLRNLTTMMDALLTQNQDLFDSVARLYVQEKYDPTYGDLVEYLEDKKLEHPLTLTPKQTKLLNEFKNNIILFEEMRSFA